ncbi:HAMP domain-containing sensor histidine kinase [Bdellovibrionota bacterium FG-2]
MENLTISSQQKFLLAYIVLFFISTGTLATASETPDCSYSIESGTAEFSALKFNDSNWNKGRQAYLKQGESTWFRCQIHAPEKVSTQPILSLGSATTWDKTYLNGDLVGTTIPSESENSSPWTRSTQRAYFFPSVTLKRVNANLHVVAVKFVAEEAGNVGFEEGFPAIIDDTPNATPSPNEVLPALFALGLTLLLLTSLTEKEDRQLAVLTVLPLGLATAALQFFNSFYPYRTDYSHATIWLKVHIVILGFTVMFALRFAEYLLTRQNRKFFTYALAAVSLSALLFPGHGVNMRQAGLVMWLLVPITLLSGPYAFFLTWQMSHKLNRENRRILIPLLATGLSIVLFGIFDMVQMVRQAAIEIPLSGVGFLFYLIAAGLTLTLEKKQRKISSLEKSLLERETAIAIASFSSQVAHDIRSPLSALNMVVNSLNHVAEDKRVLIRQAIQRINDIANGLLRHSKELGPLAKSKVSESKEAFSPHLISSLLEMLISEKRMQYRDRIGIEIQVILGNGHHGLFANIQPSELKRTLSNLINNAVEAVGQEGAISIIIEGSAEQVVIKVRNTGKGIPPQIIPKLMSPGASFEKQDGFGLGLAHAKSTLERLGGCISIESELGKGATVSLTLPRAPAPGWFLEKLTLQENRVLIVVDDDISIHQIWNGRLQSIRADQSGIRQVSFSTPDELEKAFQEKSLVDVGTYLIDYEFIGHAKNGLDLIESLGLSGKAVLVTSRYEEAAVAERAQRIGVRMLPKNMAGFVPIHLIQEAQLYDAILIDDDSLVHSTWKMSAKNNGKQLLCFFDEKSFSEFSESVDHDTPIYVDANLANGERGEAVSQRISKRGFQAVYLVTGYEPVQFRGFKWLKGVLGKAPPWDPQDA